MKIREIQDRYEMTFVSIWRGDSDLGALYHEITPASKRRLARVITKLHSEGKLRCFGTFENPNVYTYRIS